MDPQRYEILNKLAAGDFATVYRGRDRELGREVAVKQIHQQFLSDPTRLDRYWKEAQLLASLQHPHIMTIYDTVRSRGWLVLELMNGSLKDKAAGQPLNLDYLRVSLFHALYALRFLHSKGVIHGDVKPSNLLLDKQGRVKLGDFGLARRADGDEGSLLKGTTKYMAPEVVSDQFGPVGPHSDLYSLGFSAYELMCGENFESLFPGLSAFGRDKQVAWMMWHAAPDRRLPQIGHVLAGVPEDLTRVIEKLIAKNPAERYRTAEEALRDLQKPAQPDSPAPAPAPPVDRRRRMIAIGGFAASCILSLVMLITLGKSAVKPPEEEIVPERGVVQVVLTDENKLILEVRDEPFEIALRSRDRILLNNRNSLLRQLKPGDLVTVRKFSDANGRPQLELSAARPEVSAGRIESIQADEGHLSLAVEQGAERGTLQLHVPSTVKIRFNGAAQLEGRSILLSDLQKGDRLEATHVEQPTGHQAVAMSVRRLVPLAGVLRAIDAVKRELTVARGGDVDAPLVVLPLAERVEVTVNGKQLENDKLLTPHDLKPGDAVTLQHDTQVARVDAQRQYRDIGEIHLIEYKAGLIDVFFRNAAQSQSRQYRVDPQCRIALSGERATLADLRRGDEVSLTHGAADGNVPVVTGIDATRPVDRRKWGLIVANGNFDDQTLPPVATALADAQLLREAWTTRFRVAADQLLVMTDESFIRLEQGLPAFLQKIPAEGQLSVYVAGQAMLDEEKRAYLAPKDFAQKRIATTGVPLFWLIEQLEACPAREKLLMLDTAAVAGQPSPAELIAAVSGSKESPLRKTVTVITSWSAGQGSLPAIDKQHSRFAFIVAAGYSGQADKNVDSRLEFTELFEFAQAEISTAPGGAQTPALFLPILERPPRVPLVAQDAVRSLLANMQRSKLDDNEVDRQYSEAAQLIGKEPEARLAYGLVLFKQKKLDEALKPLEDVKLSHPQLLASHELICWIHFQRRNYVSGLTGLGQLAAQLPRPKKGEEGLPESTLRLLEWCGRLREFTALPEVAEDNRVNLAAQSLDAAVQQHGPAAMERYQRGREAVRAAFAERGKKIEASESDQERSQMVVDRRLVNSYVSFSPDDLARQIINLLPLAAL